MAEEANRRYPLETGGILTGYFSDRGEPVVYAIVGPGPAAVHRPLRFTPDHVWQCRELDTLFEKSGGQWTYMGDWHTHPNGVPHMSWLDRRTLQSIAKHPDAKVRRPLMVIGGGKDGNWTWLAHQYSHDRLLGFSFASATRYLQVFPDQY
jgi:integrative and conjugative element protein (TIGR02256 family)